MYPVIHFPGRDIGTYGLCAALGLLALLYCVNKLARKRGLSGDDVMVLVLKCIIPVLVGGSLLYGLTNLDYLAQVFANADRYNGPAEFALAVATAFAGSVFYGGMLAAFATVVICARMKGESPGVLLDLFAVGVPLFHAFGRIGCFMGGCCFGIECPIGFVYTDDPVLWANGTTRFPVQLLEAGCEFALFLVMLALYNRRKLEGNLVFVYLISYGVIRFLDEFLRGDVYRGFLGPFSTSQWIALICIFGSLIYLLVRHMRRRKDASPA